MADLTVKQAAQRLNTKPRTVQSWIARGHFPNAYKLNPHARNSPYRIPENDVQRFEKDRRS